MLRGETLAGARFVPADRLWPPGAWGSAQATSRRREEMGYLGQKFTPETGISGLALKETNPPWLVKRCVCYINPNRYQMLSECEVVGLGFA